MIIYTETTVSLFIQKGKKYLIDELIPLAEVKTTESGIKYLKIVENE